MQAIGQSDCKIKSSRSMRCISQTEIKIRLIGITPFYGLSTYFYLRLGMGLCVSPAIWQQFTDEVF